MILTEGINEVKKKQFTEQELLEDLDADSAHTEEFTQPKKKGRSPLERLRGSVKRYERPTDPVWDEFFDSCERVSEDSMVEQGQPLGKG
jgi:antitoxin VapB